MCDKRLARRRPPSIQSSGFPFPGSPHKTDKVSRQPQTTTTVFVCRAAGCLSRGVTTTPGEGERGVMDNVAFRSPEIHCSDVPQVLLQAVNQHAGPVRLVGIAVSLSLDQVPHTQVGLHTHMVRLSQVHAFVRARNPNTQQGHAYCGYALSIPIEQSTWKRVTCTSMASRMTCERPYIIVLLSRPWTKSRTYLD